MEWCCEAGRLDEVGIDNPRWFQKLESLTNSLPLGNAVSS